jgi:urease accessory protein
MLHGISVWNAVIRELPTFVNIVHRTSRVARPACADQLESRADSPMLTTPHSAGSAHLTFTRIGTHTVLTRAFAASPAKLIEANRRGATCWVYAATLGGGLVGGDDIRLTVDVAAGAHALLTTQASTKVYRSLRPCTQSVNVTVGANAMLAVVPDPIVCFAGADFTQSHQYLLHADASLVLVDWITSGRHASGERWAFSRYENRFDIRRGTRRIFCDGVVLDPFVDSVGDRMGRYEVLLTAIVTGRLVDRAARDLVNRISQQPIRRAEFVASAAPLRDGGALLRMAGTSVEHVGQVLRTDLAFLSAFTGDDLWSRKW